MTKVTTKYYVFRDKKEGEYLQKFHDKGTLAFHAEFTDEIHKALTMIPEAYEQQKKRMKNLAKAMNVEIIEVNATFELSYPNGDEVREIENKKDRDEIKSLLKTILTKSVLGDGEGNEL